MVLSFLDLESNMFKDISVSKFGESFINLTVVFVVKGASMHLSENAGPLS